MFDDEKDRNKSFADQIADGLSPNPVRRSATDDNLADTISRALANSMTGNRPGADRNIFGSGNAAKNTTQSIFDDAFGTNSPGDD